MLTSMSVVNVGCRCRLSMSVVAAPPAIVVCVDGVEVDGEPSGVNDARRGRPGHQPHAHVVTARMDVDECDDTGRQTEVGTAGVMDENVVAASQGVPLELQHHVDRFTGSNPCRPSWPSLRCACP